MFYILSQLQIVEGKFTQNLSDDFFRFYSSRRILNYNHKVCKIKDMTLYLYMDAFCSRENRVLIIQFAAN